MSLRKLAGARVEVWRDSLAMGPARSFGHPPWPKWPDCFGAWQPWALCQLPKWLMALDVGQRSRVY